MSITEQIKAMSFGAQLDIKIGLSTRTVFKLWNGMFELHDLSSGWQIAVVTRSELIDVVEGRKDLLDLDWV